MQYVSKSAVVLDALKYGLGVQLGERTYAVSDGGSFGVLPDGAGGCGGIDLEAPADISLDEFLVRAEAIPAAEAFVLRAQTALLRQRFGA